MATAEQFQNLLDLFKQQMETITALRSENEDFLLANATPATPASATPANDGATGGTASAPDKYKPKKPGRPII